MNISKTLYQKLCDHYEGYVDGPELVQWADSVCGSVRVEWVRSMVSYLLGSCNGQNDGEIVRLRHTPPPERRLMMLYMFGMRRSLPHKTGINLFVAQGRAAGDGRLPSITRLDDAIQAAAYLDTAYSVLLDGSTMVPAPASEPPWYVYAPVRDIAEFKPGIGDFFQYGRVTCDETEVGLTTMCTGDGYAQVTVTDRDGPGRRDWRHILLQLGDNFKMRGPHVYADSTIWFHGGTHRVHRMMWPVHGSSDRSSVSPRVRVLLYARLFNYAVTEVSFFSPSSQYPKSTITYPRHRRPEIVSALRSIGFKLADG